MQITAGRVFILVLAFGLLATISLMACQSDSFNGTLYEEAQQAPNISLDNVKGGDFELKDQAGQIVLIYFGYTFCPDVCPATLVQTRKVFQELGDDADRVRLLFITVDKERDTPEIISNYVSAFHPNIIGLTGTDAQLKSVYERYGIVAEKETISESAVGYVVNHTARLFLIDQEGRLFLSYPFGTEAEEIVSDIQHLLK